MRKLILALALVLFSTAIYAKSIKIGIMAGPSEKVFEIARKIAKDKYHLELQLVSFTDYQVPNEALNNGDIDLNIFQTKEFLDQSIENKAYDIAPIANTFVYPMGIYSTKIKSLKEINNNATVIIPNDTSNQSRALKLLVQADLIDLKKNKENLYTVNDITHNRHNLDIVTMSAAQIARSVPDADIVLLNNDFVLQAGFNPEQALFKEDPKKSIPYINVVVAQKQKRKEFAYKEVIKVLESKEVEEETYKEFPGALKAW